MALSVSAQNAPQVPEFTDKGQLPKVNGALFPNAADLIKQGDVARRAKDYALAIDDYTKAIAADPKSQPAYLNRANSYFSLRKFDSCLADCTAAIKLKPDPRLYYARALCYSNLRQPERCMEDLAVAIQLKPDYYEALRWRAVLFKGQDEFDRALEDINAAMKSAPGKAEDYDLRCELERILERNDLAIADADQAIKIKPDFAHAYVNRGLAYLQRGKYQRAREDENAALNYDPNLGDAFSALNAIDERTGKYDSCIQDVTTACKLNPRNAGFLASKGVILIRTGDLSGGEQALQQAAKLQSNNATVIFGSALLQLKRHDLDGAYENLGKIRSWIDRWDVLGKQRAREAQILLEMNRPGDALDALNKMKVSGASTAQGEKLAIQSWAHRMMHNNKLADAEFAQAKAMLPESAFINDLANGTASSMPSSFRQASPGTTTVAVAVMNTSTSTNTTKSVSTNTSKSAAMNATKPVTGSPTNPLTGNPTNPNKTANVGKPNTRVRDKWALVIGVSQFAHPEYNLRYSAKDALDFYHYLVDYANFRKDHVLLLLNEQATRVNIMNAFGDEFLPSVSEPDDMVVIFVSTHGTPADKDTQKSRNYIVAYDTDKSELYATGVDMDELYRRLKEGVKTDRALIVMDTCYSGAGVPHAKGMAEAGNFSAKDIALGSGHLVISSSSPNERSWESAVDKNGVFTKYLINSLKSNDTKADIKLAFEQIKKEVGWEVKNAYGESQTPQLGGDWQGKELVISVPPSENRQIYNLDLLNWIRKCSAAAAPKVTRATPASTTKIPHKGKNATKTLHKTLHK